MSRGLFNILYFCSIRFSRNHRCDISYRCDVSRARKLLFMSLNHAHYFFIGRIVIEVEIYFFTNLPTNPYGIVFHDFNAQWFKENRLILRNARFGHEEGLRCRTAVRSRCNHLAHFVNETGL